MSNTPPENGNNLDTRMDYGAEDLNADNVSRFLVDYVEKARQGLQRFYNIPTGALSIDSEPVKRAVAFANVMRKEVGREGALELAILALYDLVMLVDNSLSMSVEQGGDRIKTLTRTMELVAKVYSRAAIAVPVGEKKTLRKGITAVKTLNTEHDYDVVTPAQVKHYFQYLRFEGTTPIGTVLYHKVLTKFVKKDMTRPVLVIIITDGEIEGEPKDRLKKVIRQTASQLSVEHGDFGPHAVSYQFAKIGDDKRATDLVKSLDDDKELNPYIDCLLQSKLEDLFDDEKKWHVIQKLLLGAVYTRFDKKKSAAEDESTWQDPENEVEVPILNTKDTSMLPEDEEEEEEEEEQW